MPTFSANKFSDLRGAGEGGSVRPPDTGQARGHLPDTGPTHLADTVTELMLQPGYRFGLRANAHARKLTPTLTP